MKVIKILLLLASTIVLLTACGSGGGGGGGGGGSDGDDGGGSSVQQGRFIDSSVEGLRYVAGSESGLTDAQGTFSYGAGTNVQFFIGDILIGQTSSQAVVTPINLVQGAIDETDPIVTNIVRFLLTLDDDSDPSNGIFITEAIRNAAIGQSADFSNESNVQAVVNTLTGGTPLVSSTDAQNHLHDTLMTILVGTYNGTFSGDVSGTWSINIDLNGNIDGTAYADGYGSTPVQGSATSSGAMTMVAGSVATGATFTGTMLLDGTLSGTWEDISSGESGTFSGNLVNGLTENWVTSVDGDQGSSWDYVTSNDGTVRISGHWIYRWAGSYAADVLCPFYDGILSISGSQITFIANGTATNPAAPSGYRTSAFVLTVNGTANNGAANGTYTITFSTPGWPSGLSGTWTSTRTSGGGITSG